MFNLKRKLKFKNIFIPSHDPSVMIGTCRNNSRWFIRTDSRSTAKVATNAIMQCSGQVLKDGWSRFTDDEQLKGENP